MGNRHASRLGRQLGEDVLAVLAMALFCLVLYIANPAIGPISYIVPLIAAHYPSCQVQRDGVP